MFKKKIIACLLVLLFIVGSFTSPVLASSRSAGDETFTIEEINKMFPGAGLDARSLEKKGSNIEALSAQSKPARKLTKKFDDPMCYLDLEIYADGSFVLCGILPDEGENVSKGSNINYRIYMNRTIYEVWYYLELDFTSRDIVSAYKGGVTDTTFYKVGQETPKVVSKTEAKCKHSLLDLTGKPFTTYFHVTAKKTGSSSYSATWSATI
jgi:hypothetical protein